VTAATPGIAATPFAAARAGDRIANLAPIASDLVDYVTQTEVKVDFTLAGELDLSAAEIAALNARYYLYQVQMRDQAGNVARGYRAVYLNNNSQPVLENLSNPSIFDGDATFRAALAQDSVEVFEGSLEIRYRNTAGTLVWERPGADLTSVLRMNAQIADGELFNDVIYRPQRDVEFPTGFGALGLDFVKNVQTLDPASIATAKPDSVRARVFNGFGAEADLEGLVPGDELNHSSDIPAFGGISPVISRSIQSEELSDPSFYFANRSATAPGADFAGADWSFGIVGRGEPNCTTDFCVRAIGPRSDFSNPFNGGPVLIVWADAAGTGYEPTDGPQELQWRVATIAQPNFMDPQPTRDSGSDRLYEWTFDLDRSTLGIATDDVLLAAIGIRPSGDGLLSDIFGTPGASFGIRFLETPYSLTAGGTLAMPVGLLPGTTGPIETLQCRFADEDGNPRNFPPVGSNVSIGTDGTDGCVFTAAENAEPGEYRIVATGERVDGEVTTAVTTVTVEAPPADPDAFTIQLGDATATLPPVFVEPGTVFHPLNETSSSPKGFESWTCSVEGPGLTVEAATEVVGEGTVPGCLVTIGEGAGPGAYTVTVNAEANDGQVASDEATLTLTVLEGSITPSLVQFPVPPVGEPEVVDFLVTASEEIESFTCSLVDTPAGFSVEEVLEDGNRICRVTVTSESEPGDWTIRVTIRGGGPLQETEVDGTIRILEPDSSWKSCFPSSDWTELRQRRSSTGLPRPT